MKVSEFIVKQLSTIGGVDAAFSVTGGFSMHLNDSVSKCKPIKKFYCHHEQACGFAAIGYTQACGRSSMVVMTAGCGATNALTACLDAYQDSVPVFFLSGQVKSQESIRYFRSLGKEIRHFAGADCDIVRMVEPITKAAEEIGTLEEVVPKLQSVIRSFLEDRRGPVWLSVPLDIQGMEIDALLSSFMFATTPPTAFVIPQNEEVYRCLMQSKRPVVLAGNGLHSCPKEFRQFVETFQIPVVYSFHGTDLLESDHPLMIGGVGVVGSRQGNFTIQNADLVLVLGCRLAQAVVGYRADWFAREAKIIMVDKDRNELDKDNLLGRVVKIESDLNDFFHPLHQLHQKERSASDGCGHETWIETVGRWKDRWALEMPITPTTTTKMCPYAGLEALFRLAPENKVVVCSSGSGLPITWRIVKIKKGDRFILSSQGDMGFELPAAIGAALAGYDSVGDSSNEDRKTKRVVMCVMGEGALQFNVQELQTLVHHGVPVKVIITNNDSYGANVLTQTNFFEKNFCGVDSASGISFPSTSKLASAYGLGYRSFHTVDDIEYSAREFLFSEEPMILELFVRLQGRYPRLCAKPNKDGTFSNRPFEDMEPFLDEEEMEREMIVQRV